MDTKKAQIKQLNEQVRESGDRVRQLQKGTIIIVMLRCAKHDQMRSCLATSFST